MMKTKIFRPTTCLVLTSALVLGACSMGNSYNAGSSEELLAAEGEWKLVEEKRAPSPVQKHMDSREQVHPQDLGGSGQYTENASAMHVNEDIHFRVLRLEREMSAVRSDLDDIKPRIAMLPEKSLMTQPIAQMTKPKPAPKAAVQKAVAVTGGPLRVVDVRTGVHPDKYRMVFDVSGASKFTYDLDNNEKLLLIEIPGAGWDAAMKKTLSGSSVVSGYSASIDGGVARVAVMLKAPVKILMAQAFSPNEVHGHRIVFDISGL